MTHFREFFGEIRWCSVLRILLLFAIIFIGTTYRSHAASEFNGPFEVLVQSETDQPPISRDEINNIARNLWCPLCSGVRLDTCELKACEQMRQEIAIQLAKGATDEEIQNYFVDQYGPQVLGEPPRQGFNWLAWIVPFAVLVAGALYLLMGRSNRPEPPSAQRGKEEAAARNTEAADPYERVLDQELSQYDS